MVAGLVVVFMLLRNWGRDLDKEVKKRTIQLDETNQRLAIVNEKMVASERAKEKFLSMVSHEFEDSINAHQSICRYVTKPKIYGCN